MTHENETPDERLQRLRAESVAALKLCAGLVLVNRAMCAKVACEELGAPNEETAVQAVQFAQMLLSAVAKRLEKGVVIDLKAMTQQ